MLTVTETAATRLHEMLQEAKAPEGRVLRLQREGASFEFTLDQEKPGDNKVSHAGATVLVYDEHVAQLLSGKTIDLEQTEKGPALRFT